MKFRLVESLNVDTKGNPLTDKQVDFFKGSKIRDESGNLLVCYHGSDNNKRYDTIDNDKSAYSTPSAYFSNSLDFAVSYAQRYGDKGNVYECYLNITNPLIIDANGNDFYSIPLNNDEVHISDVAKYGYENNYDGVIINNVEEYEGKVVTDFITFTNDQIKLITNQAPTNSLNMNEAFIDPEGKYTDFGTGKVTSDDIFDNRTHVSFYDQLFTNPDYMAKEENLKGHIEMLSPREYFEECATKIFKNTSVESLIHSRSADPRVLEEIKELIVKYKRQVFLPYLNYAEQNQEGLHRMLVAAELFGWGHKFPVLIVEWVDEELALQRKKAKEENRIRLKIKDAVQKALNYTFDNLNEFEEEVKAQVDYTFDFMDEKVNSFSVKHNNDETTDVEVNSIVYQFDTELIRIEPKSDDEEIELDDIDLDDLDIELDDLDLDDFLKKYGIG